MEKFDSALGSASQYAEAVHASRAAIPKTSEDYDERKKGSLIARGIEGIRAQMRRGRPITAGPLHTLSALLDAVETQSKKTEGLDDRKMALEYGLTLLSRLPKDNISNELEHKAITLLYRDLPHPPSTQMGPGYQFRSADGSGNSPFDPQMGKAFSSYSRSCTSTRALPPNELPDPGLVFDCLIKRDKFVPHPAGLSGFFFNFATTVIHSVFRTSRVDWNINETSSYVDLALLYGNTQAHQDFVRHKDGRGRLLPDVFAETRLLNLPLGVSSIIIVFNRNHNTARLINSASYANVVLSDYLSGILGTVRDGSSWTLDLASERRETDHTFLERGRGNSCSVEFNVLYRLHPAMSAEDAAYTERAFQYLFGPDADFDEITPDQFELVLGQKIAQANAARRKDKDGNSIPELINDGKPADYLLPQYNVPTFKRDPKTKRYDDDQIANAILSAIAARGVPGVMRVIEMLGIMQARNWGCCTLNEFRRFLGLKPYATFEEWNPDPDVAECARKIYRTPENLELYVGLVAEESKPVMDGAGLCPSYTMSRAILADAVALVRGDRYLTYDFTPFNLTAWGFTEANRNVDNAAFGGVLGRLIARALPNNFNDSSVWTHFPLITPTGQPHSMDKVLSRLGLAQYYTLERPTKKPGTQVVDTAKAASAILGGSVQGKLVTPYLQNIKDVTLGSSFLSHIDDPDAFNTARENIRNAIVPEDSLDATAKWFSDKAIELLKHKSQGLVGNKKRYVDVVKDVFRLVPVHWFSVVVAGLPLKTMEEPHGIYFEQQMYQFFEEFYTFIFFDADTSMKIPNHFVANSTIVGALGQIFLGNPNQKSNPILVRSLSLRESPKRLNKGNASEVADEILAVIASSSTELSQIFTHVLNFYLAPNKPSTLDPPEVQEAYREAGALQAKVISVATSDSPDSAALLEGYAREALRLDPVIDGLYRVATEDGAIGPITFKQGQRLYLDIRKIGRDENLFPNPTEIDPTRPADKYSILYGDGVFKSLGERFVWKVTGQVLKAVFSLKQVKRTKGPAGSLRRFEVPQHNPDDEVTSTQRTREIKEGTFEDYYEYYVTPVNADHAFRYSYLDVENDHRLTACATGLSLEYDV
ncbi:heme peroxidase [Cantharellus anzutake]|uniref:heme peroxidase n=1 Tax=Cantharellus anzutake TaxID=1750568 RepID=UPI0019048FCD|nr:heme peroxidase [Cantharellus anzutake]KAF8323486.1 heme peroxidase [Cantharellus anzutake]